MQLQPGTKLGSYEIAAPLGAGGMGEVYRAHDAKLRRDVAIKIVSEIFSRDSERLARFDREARLLASLNHPHIGGIYGLEESDGTRFIVLELVPGEALDQLLARGPLDLHDTFQICRQIAEALEAAHERGIIHRDLKPSNIKITPNGDVKILDFGLAKAVASDASSSLSLSPTVTRHSFESGVILGTAAYMSPEQARAKPLDRRTDIWSFGCVLYECLTGVKVFSGETVSDTIARILERQPDLQSLPSYTPDPIRLLLRRCLEKDRNRRLQHIGDARVEIDEALDAPPALPHATKTAERERRNPLGWVAAAILLVIAALLAIPYLRHSEASKQQIRFGISPPGKGGLMGSIAVSPNGEQVAFTAASDGKTELWIRKLDSSTAQVLPGTEEALLPFWSPDSKFIGFFARGKLKKIELAGGRPQTLCDVTQEPRGGTWNRDGVILFAPEYRQPLFRVSAAGGAPLPVTTLDPSTHETSHRYPCFLPDGKHFIYWGRTRAETNNLYVGSLDGKERVRVVQSDSGGMYVPPGYLLFIREKALIAQPFDAGKLKTTGDSFPVAEEVSRFGETGPTGYGCFSASANGVLAYWRGGVFDTQLVWVDRTGKQLGVLGPPGDYRDLTASPDGTTVLMDRTDPRTVTGDIWSTDVARGIFTRVTTDPAIDVWPLFSRSGDRVVFASNRGGPFNLYERLSAAAGRDEPLLKRSNPTFPDDFSPDNELLMFEEVDPKTNYDLWVVPLKGERKPVPFLQTEFIEVHGQFSPDGHWVAYASDESGADEVYVRTFPSAGDKRQISVAGGDQPRWRPDGKELYYLGANGSLMVVPIAVAGPKLEVGAATALFASRLPKSGLTETRNNYLVFDNGKRFLLNASVVTPTVEPLNVVVNWMKKE